MMKKGLDLGMPMKEAEGAKHVTDGMLAMQKNDMKQAGYIRSALRKVFPIRGKRSSRLPADVQPHDE